MKPAIFFPTLILLSLVHCTRAPLRPVSTEVRQSHALLEFEPQLNLYVATIDGDKARLKGLDHYVLEPGIHTFTLRFHKRQTSAGKPIPNSTEFDLSIEAKAGRTYRIAFESREGSSQWSAMVMDTSTQTRASSIITQQD